MTNRNLKNSQKTDERIGIVKQALNRVRVKLLDLSRRNTLLNFRESRRTIRIIDELPNETFRLLVLEGKAMEFSPYELPEEEESRGTVNRAHTQESLQFEKNQEQKELLFDGEKQQDHWSKRSEDIIDSNVEDTLKYVDDKDELPEPTDNPAPKHIDRCLQTRLLSQLLERRCKNALRHWRTGIEEAGINLLYLAIGFIEWCESNNSEVINRAPLLLVPLHIARTRLDTKTNCYSYIISYSGEDVETNLSLSEKLSHDFDLILPEVTEEVTPEDYFLEVGKTISKKKQWRVAREMVVGFFSFAKLRLYKDLNDNNWPGRDRLTAHSIIQDILVGRERSEGISSPIYGEEYDIEGHPSADEVPLVLDADSSQHSAIIDLVLNNKNLVIEGPPGTGKSQTITNVIAAALHEGKNILFVAEKKAALEVVRNRLETVGLGDFCLELHSHKTQKGRLHADLAGRLNKRFQDARVLDKEIEDFKNERQKLRAYYDLLNSTPGETKETIYDIIGVAERWKEALENKPIRFSVDNALRLTRSQINSITSALEDFARLHKDLPKGVSSNWGGFEPDVLLPGDEQDIQDELSKIKEATEQFKVKLDNYLSKADKKIIENTISAIRRFSQLNIEAISATPQRWDEKLGPKFLSRETISIIEKLEDAVEKHKLIVSKFGKILVKYGRLSSRELDRVREKARQMTSWGYGGRTPAQLKNLLEAALATVRELDEFSKAAKNIINFLPESPERFADFARIAKIRKHLEESSPDISIHAHPEHALKLITALQDKAQQEYQQLTEAISQQSNYFKIDQLPNDIEIMNLAEGIRQDRSWFARLFSSEYRRTKRSIKNLIVGRKSIKNPDLSNKLEELGNIIQRIREYEENQDYQRVFGEFFKGLKTDWPRVDGMISWSQELAKIMGSENRAKTLLSGFSENREKFNLVTKKLSSLWGIIKKNLNDLKLSFNMSSRVSDVLSRLQDRQLALQDFIQGLPNYEDICQVSVRLIEDAARAGIALQNLHEKIEKDSRFPEQLGEWFKGFNTDVKTLKLMAEWVVNIREKGRFNDDLTRWVVSKNASNRIDVISELVKDTRDYIKKFDGFTNELAKRGSLDLAEWITARNEKFALSDLIEKLKLCYATSKYLIAWSDYCRSRRGLEELGLSPIVKGVEKGSVREEDAVAHFRYAVYQSMARELMHKHSDLATFQRATYDNIKKRISKLDRSIQHRFCQRIAYLTSKRPIPLGIGHGYVRDYSEMSLITHELTKKKRHIPIRQLVRRAGGALQSIKPCFMMSPQSVAQYLAPGQTSFDLVLMDEASQLRLEDALGVIARGKQVAIVGDPKQLPPTTFFEKIVESELDEEDTTAAEEAESILDIGQTCLDNRRLRWHYRSQHEQLISFSNSEFYDNDLIVFPSPYSKNDDYGVHHHYVEGAEYLKGRNRTEAEVVALAIMDHFRSRPNMSLGVATFNIEQRDLIHDELERLQKINAWLEKKINETEDTEEPFFIKNLENVQGDERDVIFISTTYGPDSDSGQVYQRFGPINLPTGWRRLNVIITRAKKRLDLFTSMRPSDVRVKPGASRGAIALRGYLEFAEHGIIPDFGDKSGREPDSDFEIAVAKSLNRHGYKTDYQVGVAGFFIDVGVKHPDREGEYIVGIECDGASYHSAKSIRDRDLLRQRILESKGWRIHRIWSTDWFKNKDRELGNLLDKLEKLVESEKAKVRPIEPEEEVYVPKLSAELQAPKLLDVDEELRKALVEYRRTKIEPRTSDITKSLLADHILEEFVRRKPTTQKEFFRFPLSLRDQIDPKEGQFLVEILELIEEYAI